MEDRGWRIDRCLGLRTAVSSIAVRFSILYLRSSIFDPLSSILSRAEPLELRLVEPLVFRTTIEKFLMGAHGGDPAVIHHDDAIGDFQRIQAMGDHEGGTVAHELAQ